MYSVILIDDEPAVLSGLKKAIPWSEYGFEDIVAMTNPLEALELMKTKSFDLMVTDICMPNINGLELLKKVRTLYSHMSCVILTAYDEFDYVLEALRLGAENFLLKPINTVELASTVQKSLNNINNSRKLTTFLRNSETIFKENVLYRWLSGDLFGQELSERAKLAGINLFKRSYNVVVVKPLVNTLFFNVVVNSLKRCLASAYDCYYLVDSHGWSVFIVCGHTAASSEIKEILSPALEEFSSSPALLCVVGTEVIGSGELPTSYRSATDIMDYSMLFAPNSLILSEDIQNKIKTLDYTVQIDVAKLLNEYSDENAMKETNTYVSFILQSSGASLQTAQAFLIEFLLRLAREIEKSNVPDTKLPESIQNMFVNLDAISSQSELNQWLCGVVADARKLVKNGFQNVSPVVGRVLQYVETHFAEAMSIKKIASHFSVNPSYLGYLFKQETGYYFSDYLNHIRMKEAEHLLLTTDFNMSDIASKIGYSDVTYFTQIFKKNNGISPAKFRQAKKGGNQ